MWRKKLGRILLYLGGVLLVVSLWCMAGLGLERYRYWNVQRGLKETLDQLPIPPGFEKVLLDDEPGSSCIHHCYYAGALYVLGTSLSEEKAFETYSFALQDSGWTLSWYDPTTWEFALGTNERTRISRTVPLHVEFKEAYIGAKARYSTVLLVHVTYMTPSLDECN